MRKHDGEDFVNSNQSTSVEALSSIAPPPSAPLPKPPADDEYFEGAGNIHILVLDDDPSICRIVKAVLAPHRFSVDTVDQAQHMEAQLRQGIHYDLIILDYMIPEVQFEALLALIQAQQPDASIIVITGFPSLDHVIHCLRARLYDYLPKPFDLPALERAVLRCLESRGVLRLSANTLHTQLGNAIRERRQALKLTLADLAAKVDLSVGYLSQIELGKNSATIDTLYRICVGLSTRLADVCENIPPRY